MKAYKGFKKNMTCRGFQYKEGGEYQTNGAKLCEEGFHACERPLDVFKYYPANTSVYHEVELEGLSDEHPSDSKVCGRIIKIGQELSVADMVQKTIEWHKENGTLIEGGQATGDRGAASATGCCGAASATGYRGAASATGDRGAASATGYRGAASATGDCGAASADSSTAIAVAWGAKSCVKGVIGAHIVCAEWQWDKEVEEYKLIAAKMGVIDGKTLKPDTCYTLKNGEFVEGGY